MKLTKIKPVFFTKENIKMQEAFQFLDQYLDDIFPDKVITKKVIKNLNLKDRQANFIFHVKMLPFHMRDHVWLAMYIERALTQLLALQNNEEVTDKVNAKKLLPYCNLQRQTFYFSPSYETLPVDTRTIVKYVKTSPKFNAKLTEFEQNLARAYIENWIVNGKKNFYYTYFQKLEIESGVDYAKVFPDKVIEAMTSLGIEKKNVEIALASSTNIWLRSALRKTFVNRNNLYSVANLELIKKSNLGAYQTLINNKLPSMENWTDIMENEYYKSNKKMIDKYGVASSKMKMDSKQIAALRTYHKRNEMVYQEVLLSNFMGIEK